ncbi:chemosensory receptor a [Plakobranchus ocellatus]|uniref:Chemosensory receptor a n=1 Tax=Plakobranchus ocellatus TaxID=259542 RepID=A0AAV3ZJX9_9GAST|nr:chemosensory receptor a [Plakobranchus ocellatus]
MHPVEEATSHSTSEALMMVEDYLQTWRGQKQDTSENNLANGVSTEEQMDLILLIIILIIEIVNLAGLVGNILNIAVFVRLGFSEPSNISLTALAAADLVSLVLSIWIGLCYWPPFRDSGLPFNPLNLSLHTGAGLRAHTIRTVACITAFISFERCLCILMPLKVKRIITPKFTKTAMFIIGIFTVVPYIVIYFRYYFAWVIYPHLNATILDIVPNNSKGAILMDQIVMAICGVIQPIVSFVIVLVSTIFLIVQLRKIASWRKSVMSAGRRGQDNSEAESAPNTAVANAGSSKEERLTKMVVVIATNFIVCFVPTCVFFGLVVFEGFALFGSYRRKVVPVLLTSYLTESVSASVNILIYYNMSAKFRSTLRLLLQLDAQAAQAKSD